MTAPKVARVLYQEWIFRYGCPLRITTDQGSQFESALYKALLSMVGCKRLRTTAYHPKSNGLIEGLHRPMKAAIMCIGSKHNWVDLLPTVMLGLRAAVREDIEASPAEYVFGKVLRLPGELFAFGEFEPNRQIFIEEFREPMKQLQPIPMAHDNNQKPFVFKKLPHCSHVWLRRRDTCSLDQPYEGPYKVEKRWSDLDYSINRDGEKINVSTERLKPAFISNDLTLLLVPEAPSIQNTTGVMSSTQLVQPSHQLPVLNTGTNCQQSRVSATVISDHSYANKVVQTKASQKPQVHQQVQIAKPVKIIVPKYILINMSQKPQVHQQLEFDKSVKVITPKPILKNISQKPLVQQQVKLVKPVKTVNQQVQLAKQIKIIVPKKTQVNEKVNFSQSTTNVRVRISPLVPIEQFKPVLRTYPPAKKSIKFAKDVNIKYIY